MEALLVALTKGDGDANDGGARPIVITKTSAEIVAIILFILLPNFRRWDAGEM
jgi:hypothetical protein